MSGRGPDKKPRARRNADDRFWSKVDRRGPDDCWPWTAGRNAGGYGFFDNPNGSAIASRIALEETIGRTLGRRELACHSCDNPPCCNPAHLFVGTALDNAGDASRKGRMATGDRNIRSREPYLGLRRNPVGPLMVRVIRGRYAAGEPGAALAREYHLNPATVSRIVNGSRHVGEAA